MQLPLLSITIPVFNEGENILHVVEDCINTFSSLIKKNDLQLILINDGSSDTTATHINELANKYDSVEAIHHNVNRGFGGAIKSGFRNSKGQFVSLLPGDGEVKAHQILKFLNEIGDYDILVSERICSTQEAQDLVRPWSREVLTAVNKLLFWIILGFYPKRMQGIFLVRNDILKCAPLFSNSGLLCTEIFLFCKKKKCSFTYSKMEVAPRLSGVSKVANISTIIEVIFEMIKLRIRLITNKGLENKQEHITLT